MFIITITCLYLPTKTHNYPTSAKTELTLTYMRLVYLSLYECALFVGKLHVIESEVPIRYSNNSFWSKPYPHDSVSVVVLKNLSTVLNVCHKHARTKSCLSKMKLRGYLIVIVCCLGLAFTDISKKRYLLSTIIISTRIPFLVGQGVLLRCTHCWVIWLMST